MKALDWLRYSPADSGPIGYNMRVGLVAMFPMLPFIFFVDPRSISPTETTMFCAAILWGVTVFAFGVKELFASAGKKRG